MKYTWRHAKINMDAIGQRVPLGARLCRVQQRAKKSHYQSKVFVCVSNNRADAVDWLLILNADARTAQEEVQGHS